MRHTDTTEVIFSSLFFLLALFTLLTVGLSQHARNFTQLFTLVNSKQGIYELIFDVLAIFGFLLSMFFIFFRKKHKTLPKKYRFLMWLMGIFFAALIALNSAYDDFILVKIEELSGVSIGVLLDLLNATFFCMFVFLPLTVLLREMEFDHSDTLGRFLHTLRPSISVAICTLFMLSLEPVIKESILGYAELAMLIIGLVMISVLWVKKRHLFGFYENFNLLLLMISVAITSLSYEILKTEHNAMKMAFCILILIGWSARWCERITR